MLFGVGGGTVGLRPAGLDLMDVQCNGARKMTAEEAQMII